MSASLPWAIAGIGLSLLIGLCVFWAMERIEVGRPLRYQSPTRWGRIENIALGAIIAGVLIRAFFLFGIVFLAGCAGAQDSRGAVPPIRSSAAS